MKSDWQEWFCLKKGKHGSRRGWPAQAVAASAPEPGIPETATRYRLEVGVTVYLASSKGYSKAKERSVRLPKTRALTPDLLGQSIDLLLHLFNGRLY